MRAIKTSEQLEKELTAAQQQIAELKAAEISSRETAKRLQALYAITSILAESAISNNAVKRILQVICESLGWVVGAVWSVDREANVLRCVEIWHVPEIDLPDFEKGCREHTFSPGVGLPGSIWTSGKPAWISDVVGIANFPRRLIATKAGLRGAIAIPILVGGEITGVMEFFSQEIRQPDEILLQSLTTFGSQIGQYIERIRVEEQLRHRERELTDFFENAALGLHWVGSDGRILWANQAEMDMLGYSKEEYFGRNIADFHADRNVIDDILRRLSSCETLHSYEARLKCKDGSIKTVLISSNVSWEDGKFAHTRCFTRDITERKLAEEALRESEGRFRAAFNHDRIGMAFTDLKGRFLEVNPAYCRITGYTEQELSLTDFQSITHPEDLKANIQLIEDMQAEKISGFMIENRYIRKDGSLVWVQNSVSVQPSFFAWISYDITGIKEIEKERSQLLIREQEARREAEEANRTKDEFIAIVSHELRTPLTAMLGWVRLMRNGKLDQQSSVRALETIERNVKAQAQLIEDLLDISRIVTRKLQIHFQQVELDTVIKEAVDSIRPAADAKHIHIRTIFDSGARLVSGDIDRLRQIIWNLLSNSIKFTPEGGSIEVQLEKGKDRLEVTVKDTGQGIKPEFLPFIFDRFRQADVSNARTHGGLGLGLAIVKHLVELHGGTIKADSPGEEKGATFTIQLPYIQEKPHSHTLDHKRGDNKIAAISSELVGLNILVVDDELDTRELIKTILEQSGASVMVATSAAEALEQLQKSWPDLLISDIAMPEADGYELISKVRIMERGDKLPAVALTAHARVEDRIRVLSAGFQMHVPKPIEPDELVTIIAGLTKVIGKDSGNSSLL
jgi:PAS domain S-box-containing protein